VSASTTDGANKLNRRCLLVASSDTGSYRWKATIRKKSPAIQSTAEGRDIELNKLEFSPGNNDIKITGVHEEGVRLTSADYNKSPLRGDHESWSVGSTTKMTTAIEPGVNANVNNNRRRREAGGRYHTEEWSTLRNNDRAV
jgi:hypothetical protein